jgi:hypothetical protein
MSDNAKTLRQMKLPEGYNQQALRDVADENERLQYANEVLLGKVKDRDEDIAKMQAVVDAGRAAAKFCLWCCEYFFDGLDIDGGDAQDKMVELGLLEQRPTPEDSEWYGEYDFLYFPTDGLRALDGEVKP